MLTLAYYELEEKTMAELTILAAIENLKQVLALVDAELEAQDCPMKAQMQIDMAIEEIFVNVARYAYAPKTGSVTVRLELEQDPRRALITFLDHGIPYDPLAKPDPDVTLSAQERQIGGLGIFMVKKTMDEMRYQYAEGQNILTLVKHF